MRRTLFLLFYLALVAGGGYLLFAYYVFGGPIAMFWVGGFPFLIGLGLLWRDDIKPLLQKIFA